MIVCGWGAASDVGRVRRINEDDLRAAPPVFVVADGMGGHAAGDVASHLAVDAFAPFDEVLDLDSAAVLAAVGSANRAILAESAAQPDRAGMGTTVAGLAVVRVGGREHWMVFNVGDSRVYRYADGALTQLTIDHSEVAELLAAGRLSVAEARSYARRHVVTRALGTDGAVAVDSWLFPPHGGERFVICSDGLTSDLQDGEIVACLEQYSAPQQAADALVDRALDAGGRDNITVIVVDGRARGDRAEDACGDTRPRSAAGLRDHA